MSEKVLFCISNSSTDIFDNSITSFTNKFPQEIHLSETEKWEVSIESIGLDYRRLNFHLPKDINAPHVWFNFKKYNIKDVSHIRPPVVDFLFFNFPELTYNMQNFKNVLEAYNRKFQDFLKIELETDSEGKYVISLKDGEKIDEVKEIYIHETIFQSFGFKTNEILKDSINHTEKRLVTMYQNYLKNEPYIVIKPIECEENENKNLGYCTHGYNKHREIFPLQVVEKIKHDIILIKSKDIESQIFNSSYEKTLGYIVLNYSDRNRFNVKTFKTKEHFPLVTTLLTTFNIFLTDINHNPLFLSPGTPTYVKLHLQKMERETKILKVTSESTQAHPNNTNNKFSILLPEKIFLPARDWKVALSSISLRPDFATFTTKNFILLVHVYRTQNGEYDSRTVMMLLGPGNYTVENIIEQTNKKFFPEKEGEPKLLRMRKNDNNKVEIDIGNYPTYKDGTTLEVFITKNLLYFLGFDVNKILQEKKQAIKFTVQIGQRNAINFFHDVRSNGIVPPYLFLYTNFVQPSIVGSTFTKMLKIFSVENSSEFTKVEFEHLEFFKIEPSVLENLHFELRTHTGELVHLGHKEDIILSLILQR